MNVRNLLWIVLVVGVVASVACAQPETPKPAAPAPGDSAAKPAFEGGMGRGIAVLGCAFGAALAAAMGGYGIAKIATSCLESIARQPEAGGQLFAPMIITAAMVEGAILFAILVSFLAVPK